MSPIVATLIALGYTAIVVAATYFYVKHKYGPKTPGSGMGFKTPPHE